MHPDPFSPRKLLIGLAIAAAVIGLALWVMTATIGEEDLAIDEAAPPAAGPIIAPVPPPDLRDRAGLDPVPVRPAAPEPTLEQLQAAARAAPPPELTAEEIEAGRTSVNE